VGIVLPGDRMKFVRPACATASRTCARTSGSDISITDDSSMPPIRQRSVMPRSRISVGLPLSRSETLKASKG
jgi:hypothetical protein